MPGLHLLLRIDPQGAVREPIRPDVRTSSGCQEPVTVQYADGKRRAVQVVGRIAAQRRDRKRQFGSTAMKWSGKMMPTAVASARPRMDAKEEAPISSFQSDGNFVVGWSRRRLRVTGRSSSCEPTADSRPMAGGAFFGRTRPRSTDRRPKAARYIAKKCGGPALPSAARSRLPKRIGVADPRSLLVATPLERARSTRPSAEGAPSDIPLRTTNIRAPSSPQQADLSPHRGPMVISAGAPESDGRLLEGKGQTGESDLEER